jgi:hypothetical protein
VHSQEQEHRRSGVARVVESAIPVDLALLEMAVNGTALDAGQAALVRQMCTSGARLQLAIGAGGVLQRVMLVLP